VTTYVVVEDAGTDAERVVYETATVGDAYSYCGYYSPKERGELGMDVMRRRADGSLTTEL